MKKIILLIVSFVCFSLSVFAEDGKGWRFIFSDMDQHTDILMGFCPSYVLLGAGYDFNPTENTSELSFEVGGGYMQRRLWQNPENGTAYASTDWAKEEVNSFLTYDFAEVDLNLKYIQGFFGDVLQFKAGIDLRYEMALDNINAGKVTSYGPVNTLDGYLGPNYNGAVYPDLAGNHQFFGTAFDLELVLDMMEDTIVRNDGFKISLYAAYAPLALNNGLDGYADYYTLQFNAVGAVTLYEYRTAHHSWFSIVLIDRFNASWTDGSAVPVYAQELVSLGRRVRGYSKFSYNTEFTMVNNLDIRFSGPGFGVEWLRPRINLFFDIGLGAGDYFNMNGGSQSYTNGNVNLLMSTGAQFTVTLYDVLDLGCEIAYLIGNGEKFQDPGSRFVWTFTFFLDF